MNCQQESHVKKNGLCTDCNTIRMREYRAKNKDKIKNYQQQYDKTYYQNNKSAIQHRKQKYYQDNKEKILLTESQSYQQHPEEKKEYNKNYYSLNKQRILEQNKIYQANNIKQIREYHRHYQRYQRSTKISFKLRYNISASINNYLKSVGSAKQKNSCLDYLGYSIDNLIQHLESQFEPWMHWSNYGSYRKNSWQDHDPSTWTWQIDHIIPQSSFYFTSMADPQFLACWGLNNLRPYSSKMNLLDSNKRV